MTTNGQYEELLKQGQSLEEGAGKNYHKAYLVYNSIPRYFLRGEACYRIGKLLMKGDTYLKKDYKNAIAYLDTASGYRNANARYEIGRMHDNGWGVEVNHAEAKRMYHQALDLGCFEASKEIGLKFLHAPAGVKYDLNRAERHLLLFEEHCTVDSETHIALGSCYRARPGEKNYNLAINRFMAAVDLNDGLGCYCIGSLYEEFPPNYMTKVVEWYEKGTAMKDHFSMSSLAKLYASGKGVRRDIDTARKLFANASNMGSTTAKKELEILNSAKQREKEKADKERSKIDNSKPNIESSEFTVKPESESNLKENGSDNEANKNSVNSDVANESKRSHNNFDAECKDMDEQLVKIYGKPVRTMTNKQIRNIVNERCMSKLIHQTYLFSGEKRGCKFKTKLDLKEQFKKVGSFLPPPPTLAPLPGTLLYKQKLTNLSLQSNPNVIQLTQEVNRIKLENKQNTSAINHNTREIEKKFEEMDSNYEYVYQKLDELKKESAEKDKTIDMLMAKLNFQSLQLEILMKQ